MKRCREREVSDENGSTSRACKRARFLGTGAVPENDGSNAHYSTRVKLS